MVMIITPSVNTETLLTDTSGRCVCTMAAELLELGLLDDSEYLKLLQKLTSDVDVSVSICEMLIRAVEAREIVYRSTNMYDDNVLYKAYLNLLQRCLLPKLEHIINKYTYCNCSSDCNHQTTESERLLSKPPQTADERETGYVVSISGNEPYLPVSQYDNCDSGNNPCPSAAQSCIGSGRPTEDASHVYSTTIEEIKRNDLHLVPTLTLLIVKLFRIISLTGPQQNGQSCNFIEDPINQDPTQVLEHLLKWLETMSQSLSATQLDTVAEEGYHKTKVLSLMYANLLKYNWYPQQNLIREPIRRVMERSMTLIEASHDSDITAVLLTLVVQPYLEIYSEEKTELIKKLWHLVKNFYSINGDYVVEEKNTTGFLVLCFMAGHMFCRGCFCEIGQDDALWKIIQSGLTHTNPLTRKRSQYILKRTVDFCFSVGLEQNFQSSYLYWDEKKSEDMKRHWNDFFLLIETLEEKQTHVLKPVLEKLDNLIKISCRSTCSFFHISWILTIFRRIFDNDNKNIRQWGVMKILQLEIPQPILISGVLSYITEVVLPVLSDYSLYGRDLGQQPRTVSTVGDQIFVFLKNVVNSLDVPHQKDFMCSLLTTVFDGRPWGGVSLFYLIRGLANIPNTPVWSYEIVKSAVVCFEGCLSTQEVAIRSANQCDLLKAILKHLTPETKFTELCDIIGHFRRKESWCRGTAMWKTIVHGLDYFHETWQNRYDMIHCGIIRSMSSTETVGHPSDLALGINLLLETSLQQDGTTHKNSCAAKLLYPISNFLSDCHLRPYLDSKKLTWVLEFLTSTLEIMCDGGPLSLQVTEDHTEFTSCLTGGIDCIVQLFMVEVGKYNQPYEIEIVLQYLTLLAHCNTVTNLRLVVQKQYPEVVSVCKTLLSEDNDVKTSFGIFIVEHLLLYYYNHSPHQVKTEILTLVLHKVIQNVERITQRRQIEGYKASEYTKKLLLETTRSCWCCIHLLLNKVSGFMLLFSQCFSLSLLVAT